MTRRHVRLVVSAVLLAALAWYLHDPPWLGRVSANFSEWRHDENGTSFRWTVGRASFYVPSDVDVIVVPLRAQALEPGFLPVTVTLAVDGRVVDAIRLHDETWQPRRLWLAPLRTSRRHRRIEVHANKTHGEWRAGVQVGAWRGE